ncbi:N4-gp56 family major capsid protein [Sphingomonas paeninsulae]|nr:N4-gp56 family major capsid protein [Sphingomonas paeninsulae]
MSSTSFTAASPLAVKVWARKAFNDSVKPTLYGMLTGTSDRSVVQIRDELGKEGDRVRFRIRMLPQGIGVQDSESLEGKEESLDYKYFDLNLGEKRHAFQVELNLSEQRTMADVRSDMKDAIEEWTEEYIDRTFFEYLTGFGQGPAGASWFHPSGALGGNALQAPTADRIVYGGIGVASKAALAATDTMSFAILDKLAERAKLATPTMRKAKFNGKLCWVVILHPYHVTDLRKNTGNLQWADIVKASMQGGGENMFEHETLGMYRDMLLVESTRCPTFTDYGAGGNVQAARALFLGAQAAVTAFGQKTDDKGRMKLVEKSKDYGKYLGTAATFIWGLAKTHFVNQSDFGVFAVDTAAAPVV